MDLALITAKQVVELFIMIAAGVVLKKAGMIGKSEKCFLTGLLIKFVVPCMILNSYMGSMDSEILTNVWLSFVYSTVLCILGIVITLICSGFVCVSDRGIFKFACSFSNAAYMGFPLIRALFGNEGIMYAGAYVTVFNILLWTIGCVFFSDKLSLKKLINNLLTCPPIIAVVAGLIISFCNVPVVDVLSEPIGMVGAMTTPLSMIITGVTMAECGVVQLLRKKNLFKAVLIRLIVIPAVSIGLFMILKISGTAAVVTLILEACPAAAITTMFAIQYKKDEQYAAAVVVMSTILSIITLPACAYLLTGLL